MENIIRRYRTLSTTANSITLSIFGVIVKVTLAIAVSILLKDFGFEFLKRWLTLKILPSWEIITVVFEKWNFID